MNVELLNRRVAKVLPDREALEALMAKKKLRVYLGVDPTGSRLHIGHAIGIKKLMEFAAAGHEVILLFGTGTVLVGDPSQRDHARKAIGEAEIATNIATWKEQVAPIVDFDKVTIKQNGDWITKLGIKDVINIASHVSAVQLFKRESFTRRLEKGDTVWYHETMYPLLQGYDSVVMDVDLEIGGTDQEFNMLMGRELQKKMNDREKFVLTTPMILGPDGQQMSKTTGNCIWLNDEPNEMYGKLMTTLDAQIIDYLRLCTDVDETEVDELEQQLESGTNPRDVKARMALEVTSVWHGADKAKAAQDAFVAQFQDDKLPEDIPEKKLGKANWQVSDLLVETGLASSKSEARRLLEQGGVRLNQVKVESESIEVQDDDILQVGKRHFARLKL